MRLHRGLTPQALWRQTPLHTCGDMFVFCIFAGGLKIASEQAEPFKYLVILSLKGLVQYGVLQRHRSAGHSGIVFVALPLLSLCDSGI